MSDIKAKRKLMHQSVCIALSPVKEGLSAVKEGFSSVKELSPVKKGLSPVKKGWSPVNKGLSPVKKVLLPVKKGLSPVKKGFSPGKKALSPVKKELLHQIRKVETKRMLLPDAPPRKRHARMVSPERDPCIFMPGVEPLSAVEDEPSLAFEGEPSTAVEDEPSWVVEVEPSLMVEAEPSWVVEADPSLMVEAESSLMVETEPFLVVEAEPFLVVEAEPSLVVESEPSLETETGPSAPSETEYEVEYELKTDADMEVYVTPYDDGNRCTTIGIHEENMEETIEEFVLTVEDDDLYVCDETDIPQTILCNASVEPACTTDCTDFELRVLQKEDAINDIALRTIAPENAYDFNWSNDETIFQGRQETFTGPTPGPTFDITEHTSILDVFYKMFDVEFIDMICRETNLNAIRKINILRSQKKLKPQCRLHQWKPTNRDEMITFLAIIILQGLYPMPTEESYFKSNGFGTMPFFRQIMTYNRYFLLNVMMHFANHDTTDNKNELWRIKPLIEYFNKKFSSLYNLSKEIVVDESLLKWHGRLSFAQKISTKAARVGVKTYELCESSSGYLWKFIVHGGKNKNTDQRTDSPTTDQQTNYATYQIDEGSEDNACAVATELMTDNIDIRPSNATALIVYQLVEPLLFRGHTLIMDNFYNSPLLARCLKRQKTDVYGTLRLYRQFVPDSLRTLTKTDLRRGEILVSYCPDLSVMAWRDATLVGMISTFHLLRVGCTHKKKLTYKPSIVLDYNKHMGGVDRKDQFLSAQPVERTRLRNWYLKLFRHLFNAALFNSFVIFSSKNPNISHRRFRTLLAEDMIKAHRKIDLTSLTITINKFKKDKQGLMLCNVEDDHFPMRAATKRSRCYICAQQKIESRTVWKCRQCQVSLCIEPCFRAFHKNRN